MWGLVFQKSHYPVLNITKVVLIFFGVMCILQFGNSNPVPGQDDERYVEREYQSSSPGAHELATWLIAQLRQSSNQGSNSVSSGCRYPTLTKRNSEIINSLLRLPQIDNGRK